MDLDALFTEAAQYITITGLFIISMLAVVGTWTVKSVVETAYPQKLKKAKEGLDIYPTLFSRWWFRVILPILPILFALLTGLVRSDIFFGPRLLSDGLVRAFFCIVIGWFSEMGYRIFRQALKVRTGVELPDSPTTPPEAT